MLRVGVGDQDRPMTNVWAAGAEQQEAASAPALQSANVECDQVVQLYVTDFGTYVFHILT